MLKKQAHKFFRWYCHPDYYEDIQGDLEELYHDALGENTLRKADWLYAKEVLLLFRPSIIRPFPNLGLVHTKDMFKNYLKIGFRNLAKHQYYTAIHILGLALGLAAFLLIHEYTAFEKSYDTFHDKADQLYRLTTDEVIGGKISVRDAMSYAPAGAALQAELPEVLSATTTFKRRRMIFKKDGEPIEESNVLAVDSNFLNLFSYKLLAGEKSTLFKEPFTIVLTENQAKKYFGDNNPIGQTIQGLGYFNQAFKVTGVIENIPPNTHYKFDILISIKSYAERLRRENWSNNNYYTYLRLSEQADLAAINAKLPIIAKKYMPDENSRFNIQAVKDIHLHSDYTYEPEIHGSAKGVYFLEIVALFILIIAWINYVNLSTARATERAKEVGLRKVVGAKKGQLIGQFFTESLLVNIFGGIVAILIAQAALPYFNELVGKTLLTDLWKQPTFLKKLGLFCLLGTLLTGIYPALILSSFQPIGVLKSTFSRTKQGATMRKGLVIFQFATSLALIAATVIVYQQIQFMTQRDMGFQTEKIIGFNNAFVPSLSDAAYESKYLTFLEEVQKELGVVSVASISSLPGGGSSDISSTTNPKRIIGHTDVSETTVYVNRMNDGLLNTLDIQLVAGRGFDRNRAGDSAAVILNQSLLDMMGVPDANKVINESFKFGEEDWGNTYKIVGVIKDYNRSSLKKAVEPTLFLHNNVNTNTVVHLNGEGKVLTSQIAAIKNIWQGFYPDAPFNYSFLDKRFEKLYKEDRKFGSIFANFAFLAVIVAILGLFGLASYLSVQRAKEVGVRKVLGASTTNIILLFFKDFMWLIVIAVLIGIPIIYWSMNDWLNGYAYRIDFPWWVILASTIMVGLLAFITVSFQTYKIASSNPANTIKQT